MQVCVCKYIYIGPMYEQMCVCVCSIYTFMCVHILLHIHIHNIFNMHAHTHTHTLGILCIYERLYMHIHWQICMRQILYNLWSAEHKEKCNLYYLHYVINMLQLKNDTLFYPLCDFLVASLTRCSEVDQGTRILVISISVCVSRISLIYSQCNVHVIIMFV